MRMVLLVLGLLVARLAHAFGVVVLDAQTLALLPPSTSSYQVQVENQVAVTRVHSEFINPLNHSLEPVWFFPLGPDASATRLRYRMDGVWHEVAIGVGPQDPSIPGGPIHPSLRAYMGGTPLIFHFENELAEDSTLVVELDYVELLEYDQGRIRMTHPGDLSRILPNHIFHASYDMEVVSTQALQDLQLESGQSGAEVTLDAENGRGQIHWDDPAVYPDEDFQVVYQVDQEQFGLFATSTLLPVEMLPEEGPAGFLMFLAQPDPTDNTLVMDKMFTLIIDRSGSMYGSKMTQAKAAANFIVDHLNPGDLFNLVSFASTASGFRTEHVPVTTQNISAAHSYINSLPAQGGTNISGAFSLAVPQFQSLDSTTANIILFFTDGQATEGITNETALIAHVDALFSDRPQPINLFSFGIGSDVNHSLLGLISSHNNGFAEFLENNELEERISDFYLRVRNPVLIHPAVSADPPVVELLAPLPLPNLYLGDQLVVAARYQEPQPIEMVLSGTSFGRPVQFRYPLQLADGYEDSRAYLTKVWAKCHIETLLVQYSLVDPESPAAVALHDEIVRLSLLWGVVTPFTSFQDDTAVPDEDENPAARPSRLLLVENHPNPFNPSTTLRITLPAGTVPGALQVRVYNLQGQLVRTLGLLVHGAGEVELVWDGRDEAGREVASGPYLLLVSLGDQLATHRVLLLR